MTIKPWVHFVTVVDVEHEDVVARRKIQSGFFGSLEVEQEQGIAAGIVQDIGEDVPVELRPGAKVYFSDVYAIEIGDVKVVNAGAIVAYEDAP